MEGVQGKKKEVCLNTIKQQKELALTSLYLLNGLLDGDVQLLTSAELAVQTYYNLFTFEKNCELKATAKRVFGSFGNLAKVGAVREAVLRQSFARHGQHYDQHLWSILADDWKAARSARVPQVH